MRATSLAATILLLVAITTGVSGKLCCSSHMQRKCSSREFCNADEEEVKGSCCYGDKTCYCNGG
ncbi:hypothetical protein BDZ90DRAFT_228965 [Jaminaea rosea]|uniref:Uncharacterized protein n=1 Tax=Jaminaea rosea TaxID=1569628 RepID=A0A316UX93_9BASI|nr:hypothetical protein BDZ90DRAFT_228965 [Jaminaea rosea]PWN29919.1 hypothetical protein BDZ90DRAFT_228965 [Jaminaea rosea]